MNSKNDTFTNMQYTKLGFSGLCNGCGSHQVEPLMTI